MNKWLKSFQNLLKTYIPKVKCLSILLFLVIYISFFTRKSINFINYACATEKIQNVLGTSLSHSSTPKTATGTEKFMNAQDFYLNQEKNNIDGEELAFFDDEGRVHHLHEFLDNLLIVYFWASWCIECVAHLEKLNVLQTQLKLDKIDDIKIVPLSLDSKNAYFLKALYKQKQLDNLPLFIDKDRVLMTYFNVNTPPFTLLLDKAGTVMKQVSKNINWDQKDIYQNLIRIKDLKGSDTKIDIETDGQQLEKRKMLLITKNKSSNSPTMILE
ncbi:hypothetical protein MIDIC_230122 [Alphaproteobacteria bacterium]